MKKNLLRDGRLKLTCFSVLLLAIVVVRGQGVMLQGWTWDYPARVGFQTYAQAYLNLIPDFAEAGFNYIWLPPLSRGSTGTESMGYDIEDYYDLGEYGLGATRFGTRKDVNNVIAAMHRNGIQVIADMVYNQRVGGLPENNPVVQNWITTYNENLLNQGYQVYPNDRFRCYLLVGGATGNGAGTYYFKFRSASQSSNFYYFPYTVQMWTHKVPVAVDSTLDSWEFEPNDGGECGDSDNYYIMGYRKYAHVDGVPSVDNSGGCGIDEFKVILDTSDFEAGGDTIFITMTNDSVSGLNNFSDQYLYDVWNGNGDSSIKDQVVYQTMTDFTQLPSHRGGMTWRNFKPDGNPTMLSGDWDAMLFFYDIDQYVQSTIDTISAWQEWMYDSVGIDGMRLDAVKNYTYIFTAQNLDSLHAYGHNPQMVVGEYYDGNPSNLIGWINNVKSNMSSGAVDSIQPRLFDFALRFPLQSACDQFGYDVRNLFNSGIVDGGGGNAANAVPWVNNHDFREPGQTVSNNPELAYAYILTNPKIGTPCIYLGDYQASNFMRGRIKGLMHASKKYITGADETDYLTSFTSSYTNIFNKGYASTTIIYQIHNPTTNRTVIVAINFAGDSLDVYQKVNTAYIGAGDTFTDIFGINNPTTTNITPNNELHVTLPPRSFTVYVQGGDIADSLISLGDTLAPTSAILNKVNADDRVIHVFPNPFSKTFNVELTSPVNGELNIELFDLSGQMLYSQRYNNAGSGTIAVNPPLTASGIYLLKVTSSNEEHIYKMIRN